MTLFINTKTFNISARDLRGFIPFSKNHLETLSDFLGSTQLPLSKASQTSRIISDYIIIHLKENVGNLQAKDSEFLNAFTILCKKSIESLKAKNHLAKVESKSLETIKRSLNNVTKASENAHLKDFVKKSPGKILDPVVNSPLATFTFLNSREAFITCSVMGFKEDAILIPTRNRILLNTFREYCSKNPNSFINQVCMSTVKRRSGSAEINCTLDAKSQAQALKETLIDYFGKELFSRILKEEETLENLSFETMTRLFSYLEKEYRINLKESYINFFNFLLVTQNLHHLLGIQNYNRTLLEDPTTLNEIIQKFYDPQNRVHLDQIQYLNCHNANLKFIPPELKKLTALKNLSLGENLLKEIDLSHNTALKELRLGNNLLKELDLSKNKDLSTCCINDNLLKTIDLSRNLRLTTLHIGSNELAEIDLSNNAALSWASLAQNHLTKIDLSSNTALTHLYLDNNDIIEIDLSQNTALKKVNINSNKLSRINISSNTTNLQVLNLSHNELIQIDLSHNSALRHLNIEDNHLQKIDLSHNSSLKYLILDQNCLEEINLSRNLLLEEVSLNLNRLNTIKLPRNSTLDTLYLQENKLKKIDLSYNKTLRELNLESNRLKHLDLSQNSSLETLFLQGNKIREINLSNNPQLTTMDLPEGCKIISQ